MRHGNKLHWALFYTYNSTITLPAYFTVAQTRPKKATERRGKNYKIVLFYSGEALPKN